MRAIATPAIHIIYLDVSYALAGTEVVTQTKSLIMPFYTISVDKRLRPNRPFVVHGIGSFRAVSQMGEASDRIPKPARHLAGVVTVITFDGAIPCA